MPKRWRSRIKLKTNIKKRRLSKSIFRRKFYKITLGKSLKQSLRQIIQHGILLLLHMRYSLSSRTSRKPPPKNMNLLAKMIIPDQEMYLMMKLLSKWKLEWWTEKVDWVWTSVHLFKSQILLNQLMLLVNVDCTFRISRSIQWPNVDNLSVFHNLMSIEILLISILWLSLMLIRWRLITP